MAEAEDRKLETAPVQQSLEATNKKAQPKLTKLAPRPIEDYIKEAVILSVSKDLSDEAVAEQKLRVDKLQQVLSNCEYDVVRHDDATMENFEAGLEHLHSCRYKTEGALLFIIAPGFTFQDDNSARPQVTTQDDQAFDLIEGAHKSLAGTAHPVLLLVKTYNTPEDVNHIALSSGDEGIKANIGFSWSKQADFVSTWTSIFESPEFKSDAFSKMAAQAKRISGGQYILGFNSKEPCRFGVFPETGTLCPSDITPHDLKKMIRSSVSIIIQRLRMSSKINKKQSSFLKDFTAWTPLGHPKGREMTLRETIEAQEGESDQNIVVCFLCPKKKVLHGLLTFGINSDRLERYKSYLNKYIVPDSATESSKIEDFFNSLIERPPRNR